MADTYTVVKPSPLRKAIAARMSEAKRAIPHFRLVADIEMDALIALRTTLQARRPDVRLSLNDFLIKACATALIDTPAMNIQWVEGDIHQYSTADISVVTAVEGGLSTPVVRCAESKSIWDISREIKELAARAARNALKIAEISGGTFSVSNLGMHGVDQFDAIINPPQCAILAVGRVKSRCVVGPGGDSSEPNERTGFPADAIRIARTLTATLSVDHRAIDGATAAAFLLALRRRVEHPEHLCPKES